MTHELICQRNSISSSIYLKKCTFKVTLSTLCIIIFLMYLMCFFLFLFINQVCYICQSDRMPWAPRSAVSSQFLSHTQSDLIPFTESRVFSLALCRQRSCGEAVRAERVFFSAAAGAAVTLSGQGLSNDHSCC